jgi:hypothetical protein
MVVGGFVDTLTQIVLVTILSTQMFLTSGEKTYPIQLQRQSEKRA